MKKITFKLLLCLLLSSFANAQNAVATNDSYTACFGFNVFFPLDNDYCLGGGSDIVYSSVDLNPSLPGIQSTVIIDSHQFSVDSNGVVTCNNYFNPNNYTFVPYTFTDTLGNVSNVAEIYIYSNYYGVQPDVFYNASGTTTESVLNNDYYNYYGGSPFLMDNYVQFYFYLL